MNENAIRFVLAYNSPLLQSPWLEKISLMADSDFLAKIISGTISLDGENDLLLLLLLFRKTNPSVILSQILLLT